MFRTETATYVSAAVERRLTFVGDDDHPQPSEQVRQRIQRYEDGIGVEHERTRYDEPLLKVLKERICSEGKHVKQVCGGVYSCHTYQQKLGHTWTLASLRRRDGTGRFSYRPVTRCMHQARRVSLREVF